VQGYSYVLANASFYLGLSLSWLGLPLLLAAIGLEYLSDVFIWMVLFAILGGAMRVSSSGLNVFSQVELKAGLALPALCFATAGVYHLAGRELIDDLLPADHGPTAFAALCFAAAAVGFSLQSMMVGALRRESTSAFVATWGRTTLIAFAAAVFTSVSLLWLEVASEVL
jgi:hypothetical protein